MTWDNDLRSWWHLIESCIWTTTQATTIPTIKMELVNSSSKIGSLQNHKVRRLIKNHLINYFFKNSDGFENFDANGFQPFYQISSILKKILMVFSFLISKIVFQVSTIESNCQTTSRNLMVLWSLIPIVSGFQPFWFFMVFHQQFRQKYWIFDTNGFQPLQSTIGLISMVLVSTFFIKSF